MTIFLDTHIFLWVRVRPRLLRASERDALDSASVRYVSAVVLWEIAILQGLGRIQQLPLLTRDQALAAYHDYATILQP